MKNKLKNLMLQAMKAEYDDTASEEIQNILKELFETKDVELKNNLSDYLKDKNYIYIPIYVKDDLYSFYEIKNANNRFAILTVDIISMILNQMYTNIVVNLPKFMNNELDISTNTYNRNSFEKFKNNYVYSDYQLVSCIFVDINGMNEINNQYGHSFGDKVIFNVAVILKDVFEKDKVFRIGGDEFVVIVVNTDEAIVKQKIDLVKEILEKNNIYISYGLANGQNVIDINFLIDESDRLMFQNKSEFYEKCNKSLRKKYHK